MILMNESLINVDFVRQKASLRLAPKDKAALGQYMTPSRTAEFMASLFAIGETRNIRLLDAGAGIGSLSIAFFERLLEFPVESISWVGYEIDSLLKGYLEEYLGKYRNLFTKKKVAFRSNLIQKDFIEESVKQILFRIGERYNFAILNPPYKKINSHSRHRLLLREAKIETVNLYSAFLALVINLMEKGGQIVAIIPRSFCNGPYYKPFREQLLSKTAIRQIHLFGARDRAFKDEEVLQENIILVLERGGEQGIVKISTSNDDLFKDYTESAHVFEQIVSPADTEKFIQIPTARESNPLDASKTIRYRLQDLGLQVSTGPVIDFRVSSYLRSKPEEGTVPLLYPGHFTGLLGEWPKESKKPNALVLNDETRKWLYPQGYYVVVRRFSSKEERRRVVASMIDPTIITSELIGIENHLNVYHTEKNGLDEYLAWGLVVYLNSTLLDDIFRRFSGHTQVNATDLRLLRYPSRKILIQLGEWAKSNLPLTQQMIDGELAKHV
jgi:adenine-specific DNA-methyltransferase